MQLAHHESVSEPVRRAPGRSVLQVVAIAAAAVATMATSDIEYPVCTYGSTPFEGQTAVSGEALHIVGRDFDDGMPRLGGTAVRLIPLDGDDAVDVAVRRVRSDAQPDRRDFITWAVEPARPLATDTRYRLIGFDLDALDSPHHVVSTDRLADGYRWSKIERVFYTGSAPRLIAAMVGPDPDVPTVRLFFSEPMVLDGLAGSIEVSDGDGAPVAIVGEPSSPAESAHLVDIAVDVPDAVEVGRLSITVDGEARGVAGGRLHGSEAVGEPGTDATVAVATGFVASDGVFPQLDQATWLETTLNATPICTTLGVY